MFNLYADVDARSLSPSKNTRSYTLRSVPSSPGRSFFIFIVQTDLCNSYLYIFKAMLFPHFLTFIKYSHLLWNIGIGSLRFDPPSFQFAFVSFSSSAAELHIQRIFNPILSTLIHPCCQLLQTILKLLCLLKSPKPICTRSSS